MEVPPELDTSKPKRNWKKFQKLSVDGQQISKRMRSAETKTTRHAQRFLVKRVDNLRQARSALLWWLTAAVAVLCAVAAQLILVQHQASLEAPSAGGTYVEGVEGKLDSLNPLYASSSAEVAASRLLFSSLYRYDTSGKLHPDIAQSLTANEQGDSYTVKLRKDVSWHDGEPLTAEDVAFTINLIKSDEARVRSTLRANWQDIEVVATDRTTVTFTLPASYAAFPHALTFPIVPKHVVGRIAPGAVAESTFSRSPVGSGPFTFRLLQTADAVSGSKVVHMVANKEYYDEVPRLGRFELHAYPTSESLMRAAQSGEVTAAAGLTATQTARLPSGQFTTQTTPIDNGVYALLNTTNQTLKDSKVRQALQRGIDTSALRRIVNGGVTPLDLPFLEGQLSGDNIPKPPAYNLTQAGALLDEAGWKKSGTARQKDGQPLTLTITTTKGRQYEQTANQLRSQIERLGIKVNVRVIDDKSPNSNFIQDVLQARNYEILIYELPIGADPDVYAYWHSSQLGVRGYNFTNYSNKVADAALVSARDRLDPELRNAKYISFAKQWLEDVPAIGLYQQSLIYVHKNRASAMEPDTKFVSASDRFTNVTHWTVNRERVYKTP